MNEMKQFSIEYEYQGKIWLTVVEAWDRDSAMRQFRQDFPCAELRACDEENIKAKPKEDK